MTLPSVTRLEELDAFQLVRTLTRADAGHHSGGQKNPDEVLRFKADLSAGFPGRNVSHIVPPMPGDALPVIEKGLEPNARTLITTPDFCVDTVLGPMPQAFLEWIRDQVDAGHTTTRDFLDIFNHRMNLLRYEARAALDLSLNNELPEQTSLAEWLASIMGTGNLDVASQIPTRMRNWLGAGQWLANVRRAGVGLERVMSFCMACPVSLEGFTPQWRPLSAYNEQRLGQRKLGLDSYLGRRYWSVDSAVTLTIGPIGLESMYRLLPDARGGPPEETANPPAGTARALLRRWTKGGYGSEEWTHASFRAWVMLLTDNRHDVKVVLLVRETDIPVSILDSKTTHGLRLGQTAWIKSHPDNAPAIRSDRAGAAGPALREVQFWMNASVCDEGGMA